jgi:hypothetical protein
MIKITICLIKDFAIKNIFLHVKCFSASGRGGQYGFQIFQAFKILLQIKNGTEYLHGYYTCKKNYCAHTTSEALLHTFNFK